MPICRSLFRHLVWCALAFARAKAGNSIDARIAMMAMTTSSSIKVNARENRWGPVGGVEHGTFALLFVRDVARREDFLPRPTTKEWGEDRREGPLSCSAGKAPPLGPLLHCVEERESFRLRLGRAVKPGSGIRQTRIC